MDNSPKKQSQLTYLEIQDSINKRIPEGRVMRVLGEKEVYGAVNEIVQRIKFSVAGMTEDEIEEFFQDLEEKIQGR